MMNTMKKRLPDAELEVMQAVWACEVPVARAEIEEILKDSHPMAPTTLLTLLTRLSEKGFIRIEKEGRSARYYPLVSRQDYLAQQSRRFLDKPAAADIPTSFSSIKPRYTYVSMVWVTGNSAPEFCGT